MYIGVPRAACYAFQNPSSADDEGSQVTLSSTAVVKYVGIEKRVGLVSIVLRYCRNVRPTWVKFDSKDTKESEWRSRF